MTQHRAGSRRTQVAALLILVLTLTGVNIYWGTRDDQTPAPTQATAAVQAPCQAMTPQELRSLRALLRAELDRAVVEVPGRRALWSQASVLAALYKRVDQ